METPSASYTATTRSQARSYLIENENFGVSFFLSLHLPSPKDGHSTVMFDLNMKSSPVFYVVLANVNDGARSMHFLQLPLSHLYQWLCVTNPLCDGACEH